MLLKFSFWNLGLQFSKIHTMCTTGEQMLYKQSGFETLLEETKFSFPAERGSDERVEFFAVCMVQ